MLVHPLPYTIFRDTSFHKIFSRKMSCKSILSWCSLLLIFTETVNAAGCGTTFVQQRHINIPKGTTGRIVGGVEARPHSFPWIVNLQAIERPYCGGTLIRVNNQDLTDIVVTAAHCVYDGIYKLDVLAGAHNINQTTAGEQRVAVLKEMLHPSYDPVTAMNDIAVLLLEKPIKFTQTAQPACLPAQNEVVPDNSVGTVAGWGRLKESSIISSVVLMQTALPTVPHNLCYKSYQNSSNPMKIDQKAMLCAGYAAGGKDACQGDSGGPLTYKGKDGFHYLQGVVSFGEGCALPGKPGIYARVSNYVNWITSQIKALSAVYKG